MDRRSFLVRGGTVGAAAAAATVFGSSGPWAQVARARAEAIARTRGSVADPTGTTLERTLVAAGDGYRTFSEGPGEPHEVRADLAPPTAGREDRRTALATIVHLTDVHVVDSQSPLRVEFTDRLEDPAPANPGVFSSAWRPQETLCGHVADAMARALRAVGAGPVTGRPFDAAVTTGDSTDNQQRNELEWFLAVMDGGRPVAFNSGDPDRYEGVQDDDAIAFDPAYYHPDATGRVDRYKADLGFPDRPEMLDLAVTSFTPVGLPCPWYSVYGNHDGIVQGNAFGNPAFDAIATGPLKVVGLPDGLSPAALEAILVGGELDRVLTAPHAPARLVTPDPERRTVSAFDWARLHHDRRGGPGPVGHGLADDAPETGVLHYTFDIGEHVLGIGLDTVNRTGYASGSIDRPQFAWLEQQMIAHSSRYYDSDGNEVRGGGDDRYIVLFAHHGTDSLTNPLPDVVHPSPGPRVMADELLTLLHRFPNVIAFVVGHTHRNRIVAQTPSTGPDTGGFWEITTAAHIDHPQQARLIEVVDNEDGTLSLFGTLIDHAGPARPPDTARDVLDLAALSRELGLNDAQSKGAASEGELGDRNVELLLTAPFARRAAQPPAGTPPTEQPPRQPPAAPPTSPGTGAGGGRPTPARPARDGAAAPVDATPARGDLPATGAGTAAVGAALLAGAVALRATSRPDGDDDAAG